MIFAPCKRDAEFLAITKRFGFSVDELGGGPHLEERYRGSVATEVGERFEAQVVTFEMCEEW